MKMHYMQCCCISLASMQKIRVKFTSCVKHIPVERRKYPSKRKYMQVSVHRPAFSAFLAIRIAFSLYVYTVKDLHPSSANMRSPNLFGTVWIFILNKLALSMIHHGSYSLGRPPSNLQTQVKIFNSFFNKHTLRHSSRVSAHFARSHVFLEAAKVCF